MANILLVDDEGLVREAVSVILTDAGHTVRMASDGVAGIVEFRKQRPDLVIADIVMPEEEGIGLIRTIHAEAPDCPILAISGAGERDLYLRGAVRLGAMASLPKPFRPRELLSKIAELLDGKSD